MNEWVVHPEGGDGPRPGILQVQIGAFIDYYNHQRYDESLGNLTPADVHFGRAHSIQLRRQQINQQAMKQRRLQFQKQGA